MEWTIETILNLLHTTNDGRCVLADGKKNNGYLSDDAQNLITQLLINHLLQDQSKGTDLFFRKISELIVEVFPKEQKSVYFIPSKTEDQHQAHAKGKLIERWKNVARKLRLAGAISCERKKTVVTQATTSSLPNFSEEVKSATYWLQTEGLNFSNLNIIKAKWLITYEVRKYDIFESNEQSISDIFLKWPIFQSPKDWYVLEDFKIGNLITHKITDDRNTYMNSYKYALTLLTELDSTYLNGDLRSSIVISLLLVPYLIPTKTQIKNNNVSVKTKFWKPLLVESASAFAIHVQNMIKFHEDFCQREIKYLHHGATIQPYIAFVGEDIQSISSCYVRVNQRWCFEDPLIALEVCFKTFFVFNCNYPKECYDSWLIVQQLLFQLHTPHDKSTSITKSVSGQF
ncbi:unnamed protein product [Macrosiphum euphorbiae]|uniref:Uncharacterized protein n=1 Tax=Macrosiphum euphorbiae TaxID=13131 RepID=A0AAV0WYU3_9HEMI|nr:unnamed protein product [Macrosiphum euphorbiae]